MTSQHTPGPWTTTTGEWFAIWVVSPGTLVDSKPAHVADVLGHLGDQAQGVANANLIAAAPDMLAALREVLVFFENRALWTDCSLIAAVIAKAEGTAKP